MAVFKSKKTYIKRYASNNVAKKLTFSNEVKATFNTTPKLDISSLMGKEKQARNNQDKKVPVANGQSRAYSPQKREVSVSQNSSAEGRTTYAVAVKEAPKKEKVLSQKEIERAKAKEEKRLLAEKERAEKEARLKKEKEERDALYQKEKTEREERIKKEKEERDALAQKEKEEKEARALLKNKEKEEKRAKKDKAQKEKETKKQEEKDSIRKAKEEKKAEKRKKKEEKIARLKAKYNKKFFAKLGLILVIICAIGAVGYKVFKDEAEKYMAIQQSLQIHYAPEDYVFPEPSEDVAATNAAKREARYNEAMANAYVPASGEVPDLYKYDYVKSCYLTFDDGPSGPVTEKILDTLKKYDIPATFFVVGKNAEEYPDQIRRMAEEGHSIGNHSYSHDYGYMYAGDRQFDDEMNRCKDTIDTILGKEYKNLLYRFPGGSFEIYKSFYIYNIMYEGYEFVDWNSLTGDAEKENPDRDYIMNSIKETTNNGTKEDIVVLLHDAGAKQITADTLSEVIEYLKSKNYVFKAISNSNYTKE